MTISLRDPKILYSKLGFCPDTDISLRNSFNTAFFCFNVQVASIHTWQGASVRRHP